MVSNPAATIYKPSASFIVKVATSQQQTPIPLFKLHSPSLPIPPPIQAKQEGYEPIQALDCFFAVPICVL